MCVLYIEKSRNILGIMIKKIRIQYYESGSIFSSERTVFHWRGKIEETEKCLMCQNVGEAARFRVSANFH